jgi:hypothetical protein
MQYIALYQFDGQATYKAKKVITNIQGESVTICAYETNVNATCGPVP